MNDKLALLYMTQDIFSTTVNVRLAVKYTLYQFMDVFRCREIDTDLTKENEIVYIALIVIVSLMRVEFRSKSVFTMFDNERASVANRVYVLFCIYVLCNLQGQRLPPTEGQGHCILFHYKTSQN